MCSVLRFITKTKRNQKGKKTELEEEATKGHLQIFRASFSWQIQAILGALHGFQVVQKQGYMLLKEKVVHSNTWDASYGLMQETEF